MRFMSSPAAICAGREWVAPADFGNRPAEALVVRRTPRRPPHEPSACARPRSPGDHRTLGPPAQHTHCRRRHARPPRRPAGPDRRWVHQSVAASTRTRRRPRPRWCWGGASVAAFLSPLTGLPPALMTLEKAVGCVVRLTGELHQPDGGTSPAGYTLWCRPGDWYTGSAATAGPGNQRRPPPMTAPGRLTIC